MMPTTPSLHLRLAIPLRRAAAEKANEDGLTLSQLIRLFLMLYVRGELRLDVGTSESERLIAGFDERIELLGRTEADAYAEMGGAATHGTTVPSPREDPFGV